MGPEKLAQELRKRTFEVEVRGDFVIIKAFTVVEGRFAGQVIQLAFQVHADYEITPPSGFHTNPHLVPLGVNNVQQSPLAPAFAYWSRPIHDWAKQRNAGRLLSNINAVLLRA